MLINNNDNTIENNLTQFLSIGNKLQKYKGFNIIYVFDKDIIFDQEKLLETCKCISLLKSIGINIIILYDANVSSNQILSNYNLNFDHLSERDKTEMQSSFATGLITNKIVSTINFYGGNAIGLSGIDNNLFTISKKPSQNIFQKNLFSLHGTVLDIDFIFNIDNVNTNFLTDLLKNGSIPVISNIGFTKLNEVFFLDINEIIESLANNMHILLLICTGNFDSLLQQITLNGININQLYDILESNHKLKIQFQNAGIFNFISNNIEATHLFDNNEINPILSALLIENKGLIIIKK